MKKTRKQPTLFQRAVKANDGQRFGSFKELGEALAQSKDSIAKSDADNERAAIEADLRRARGLRQTRAARMANRERRKAAA